MLIDLFDMNPGWRFSANAFRWETRSCEQKQAFRFWGFLLHLGLQRRVLSISGEVYLEQSRVCEHFRCDCHLSLFETVPSTPISWLALQECPNGSQIAFVTEEIRFLFAF